MNTIEGALVFSALTLTSGMLVGGFITLAQHSAVTSIARDAARAEAIGKSGAELASARDPEAKISISNTTVGGVAAVHVSVTKKATLFDVTGDAFTIAEPEEAELEGTELERAEIGAVAP